MSLCGTDYAIGAVRNMYRESRQDSAVVAMPSKLQKGLPRRTGSLCPECLKVIPATLYIGDGALKMKKTCKEHGEFDEVCWSDAEMYLRAENWAFDGVGLENRQIVDAKEMGFPQVQVATNGIRLATEDGFFDKVAEAGLNTIYLQFDGLREENYIKARGRPLLDVKLKVIERVRERKGKNVPTPAICFVPTMVNSFNDDQAGEILNYAIKNRDVVKGVNFQPVSLTGRIPEEDRRKLRYTLSDLAYDLEEQTGYLTRDDWYPVPFVAPISELVSVLTDTAKPSFTSHPACGLASYLFLENGKDPVPITRFIDVEGLMEDLWLLAQDTKEKKIKFTSKLKALQLLKRHFKPDEAPEGMGLSKMLKILNRMFTKGDKAGAAEFSWSTMYVGGMHFQDNYNYDIERVKRCVIHYATPDGKVIPFCAYNTGPNFREEIEKKFAVPIEEWRGRHA